MRRISHAPGLRRSALLAAVLVCVAAPGVAGQRGCRFVAPTGNLQAVTIAGLGQVFYVSRPSIRCEDGVFMRADSAVVYTAQSRTELMGNVRFRDEFRELQANQARYFSQQARLQASGNLTVVDTVRGSQVERGSLVLLRRTEFRSEEEMTVTRDVDGLRPRARLYLRPSPDTVPTPLDTAGVAPDSLEAPALVPDTAAVVPDSLEAPALVPDTLLPEPDVEAPEPDTVPYLVEADRLFLQGERLFQANGTVEITREQLRAFGDSTRYDQMAGVIVIQGSARVEGEGYDLSGRDIDLGVPDGSVRTVRAIRDGVLTGDRLRLDAPVIELFLTDGAMDRLVALPLRPLPGATEPLDEAERARPVALAEEFTLTADSIEVVAPGEALDHITAVGAARGESSARDSLNVEGLPEIARHDWLEGDTVVASFVRLDPGPGDTAAARYQLDRLVASGTARSLYRLEPSDTTPDAGTGTGPAVHYVTGAIIVIVLADGDVERMEVDGPTRGWHWEPVRRARPGDTLAAPDTSVVPPDTSLAQPRPVRASESEVPAPTAPPLAARRAPVWAGGRETSIRWSGRRR